VLSSPDDFGLCLRRRSYGKATQRIYIKTTAPSCKFACKNVRRILQKKYGFRFGFLTPQLKQQATRRGGKDHLKITTK
jgi:hypothetical protein